MTNKIFYGSNLKSALIKSVELNLPALLIGDTGTGKTSFVYNLANKYKKEVIRINLTGQTGVDELIGKYLANKDGTYWIDGLLTLAMKTGKWIVFDEINMALPEILSKLHSLLDDDRKIILNEKEGEIINCHPEFRFFATMNPCEEYSGTKELNKAFVSRFPIILTIDYSLREKDILINRTKIEESFAEKLTTIAKEIRIRKKEEKLTYTCSTRDLIYCASLIVNGLKPSLAIEVAILNKAPLEERTPIGKLISLIIGDEIKINDEVSYKKIEDMINEFHLCLAKNKDLISEKDEVNLQHQIVLEEAKKLRDIILMGKSQLIKKNSELSLKEEEIVNLKIQIEKLSKNKKIKK